MTGILRSDTIRSKELLRTISTASTLLVVAITSIPSISRMAFMASHTLGSSSTTSALILSIDRHLHGKCRPFSHNAFYLDVSAVFFNDTIAHGQTEACPFCRVLGCKKRVEDLAQMLRNYTQTRVSKNDRDKCAHDPCGHLNFSRRRNSMDGI